MTRGQIHDLGYQRYAGSRRAMGTRWRVIMRHQIASTWKGWWRLKIPVFAALLTTVATGTIMYILRALDVMGAERLVRFAGELLPSSILWYTKIGFLISLFVTATVVAGDVQSGAFTFYFARSVRPRDYVLGKVAGLGLVLAPVMVVGPVLLAGFRLGLADTGHQLVELLPIVPKMAVVGALGCAIYGVVPLGFSALTGNPRYAMALWAAYDIVVGQLVDLLAAGSPLAALDLPTALQAAATDLTGMHSRWAQPPMSLTAAVVSIAGHAALAIALVAWRVRRAQQT
ncbi:MAG TPA: hypothetical protein VGC42_00215, partial [Kofleriaceae bacterium]